MEFIKAIINLITSFFQKSTVETKKEVKLADAESTAVVEQMRASENATAVQQQQKAQEAVEQVYSQQEQARVKEQTKSLDEQLDDQFGSQ